MTFPGLVKANNLSDVTDKEKAWDNLGANIATGDINVNISAPLLLNLDFAANKSLVDNVSGNNLITFSRMSTGSFVGSNGRLQFAASGVPRFTHAPSTGESLGLLIEESRINGEPESATLSVGWGPTNATFANQAILAPDGSAIAKLITENTILGEHCINKIYDNNYSGHSLSCFVKSNGRTRIRLGLDGTGGHPGASFNLSTKSYTIIGGAVAASIEAFPDNWYRISASVSGKRGYITIYLLDDAGNLSYAGNGSSGMYIWGLQWEKGVVPSTSYIPTTGSAVTRAADVATISGASFNSWSNNFPGGTYFTSFRGAGCTAFSLNGASGIADRLVFVPSSSSQVRAQLVTNGSLVYDQTLAATFSTTLTNKYAFAFQAGSQSSALNGIAGGAGAATNIFTPASMQIGRETASGSYLNGAISSITYRSSALRDVVLGALTQLSPGSSSVYSFNYVIKGKDVLSLNGVNRLSITDFVYTQSLSSAAQPRLTVATQSTASGVATAGSKLLKLSPSSAGNYFVSNGSLSAQSLKINNITAASLSTVPFSGSTALVPLSITTVEMSSNFRLVPLFSAGTVNSPTIGMPVETGDFILYGKAGQN